MIAAITKTFEPSQTDVLFFTDEYGERWAHAKGICQGLGLSLTNLSITLERHVFPEYRRQFAIGRGHPAWYLKYEGVIQLGMSAKSQFAQSFQRWVFGVIKEVIQTGQYTAKPEDQQHFERFNIEMALCNAQKEAIAKLNRMVEDADTPQAIVEVMRTLDDAIANPSTRTTRRAKLRDVRPPLTDEDLKQKAIAAIRKRRELHPNEGLPELYRNINSLRSLARRLNRPIAEVTKDLCQEIG